jgi:phage repressor protein C with HTH and peptisase S24 domain
MQEPFERVIELRKQRGFKSASAAAERFGWNINSYRSIENGNRGVTTEWADLLAKAYKSSRAYILWGEDMPQPVAANETSISIIELDVKASAGSGSLVDGDGNNEIGKWSMPAASVKDFIAQPENIRIIQVIGDSMEPDFLPGQRVFVDTADRLPSPPGVFVIWDGFGLVIKRCQMLPHSDPPRVRLQSSNPGYGTYEVSLDEAHINGRVIGKLQRT